MKLPHSLAIAIVLIAGLGSVRLLLSDKTTPPAGQSADAQPSQEGKYTRLDITLKDGQPVPGASTYVVKKGSNLEFSIASDQLGRVGFPSKPPRIISFTESPLVLRFTASDPGTYQLTFQSPGKTDAVVIGTIQVQ